MKKHAMRTRCTSFFKRALVLSILLSVGCFPLTANAFDILLGTGQAGTFSQFTGKLLSRIVTKHGDGIDCKYVPAPNDVYNLTNLQGGSLDLILIDALTLHDAVQKRGAFAFLDISYDNLRILFPVYEVSVTFVVRQDAKIVSLEDLEGKRVNAGAPQSPEHRMMDIIMRVKNWTPKNFSLMSELGSTLSEDTMAFCHGTIQALIFLGVHPDPSLQQLFKLCEADFINLADADIQGLIESRAAFSKVSIPAHTYPSQADAVSTFGTRMLLVGSADLDMETVHEIVRVIDLNRQSIRNAHPTLATFAPQAIEDNGLGLPLHPGAREYFEGHGKK